MTQVVAGGDALASHGSSLRCGQRDPQRVEIVGVLQPDAERRQPGRQRAGQAVHVTRNRRQAVGAVVDGVHRRHVGEQRLRRADVRGRLLAADVLLAGLQRHAVGAMALGVDRDANQPPRRVPHELLARREEGGVRPAEPERHAEALRVADDDVGAELAGRRQQREREQIGGGRDQHLRGVGAGDDRSDVDDGAVIVRVLQQRAEHLRRVEGPRVGSGDLEPDPERLGAALQHGHGLREDPVRDQEDAAVGRLLRRHPMQQRHRLAGRGRLVEQRGSGHGQPGEIGDDGLEVQQRFEAALGDLGLVGRVGCVPARILEHAAANHARGDRVVVAQADEAPQHACWSWPRRRAGSDTRAPTRRRAAPLASAGGWRREWLRR